MSHEKVVQDSKKSMEKGLHNFQEEMAKIRTGRASVSLLDDVRVEYYGSQVPLNQVATLSTPESRLIVIAPWDKSAISAIMKAIQKADLGLQPVDDGKVVRLSLPPLTEERRKDIVKMAKKIAEESRVAIRNVRRDGNEHLKKIQKSGDMSEDDLRRSEHSIQELTDDFIKKVDESLQKKEKEIMEI